MTEPPLDLTTTEGLFDALVLNGVAPARVQGFTPEQLAQVHAQACADLEAGRYHEAVDRGAWLVEQDPWDRRHHLVLAAALQHLGQWEAAGRFYVQALLMQATDAHCAYRAGECLGAMASFEEAREAFETAIQLSWLDPAYEEVRAAAQRRLDQIAQLGA
ncbi:BTAD domain-containing putative transcriptional regulator [Ramlibacter sp. MAHUQ-53]|uniref:BTAD domain-containing putative transcriptional regulator n=1 Tax=unclassified Ramlibacter TaxID=2617605 RepID=UPI0036442E59